MKNTVDISTFNESETLASDYDLLIVIKGFNRLEVKERVARRKAGLPEITNSNTPPPGAVIRYSLKDRKLNEELAQKNTVLRCKNPYEYKCNRGRQYYTTSESAYLLADNEQIQFKNDHLYRVHSIDRSEVTGNYLVSASGYDIIYTLDSSFNLIDRLLIWDRCRNINKSISDFVENINTSIDTPFKSETFDEVFPLIKRDNGYSVSHSPYYVTGASFGLEDEILFTGYNCDKLYVASRGAIKQSPGSFVKPHCFEKAITNDGDVYSVADSGRGELVKLNRELAIVRKYSLANLPMNPEERKEGEWLQYVQYLDTSKNLCVLVDATRCTLHIIDLKNELRRHIPYPREWSIHGVSVA